MVWDKMDSNKIETHKPRGLTLHSTAPMINTVDIHNKPISFENLLKNHNGILIDFFRGSWWTYWKEELIHLTEYFQEFKKRNIKIISISSDTPGLLRKFKEENGFPVDMISDRGAKIAKDYDVYWFAEGWGKIKVKQAIPSKFLINKNGKIIWKYIGKDKTDRPSVGAMILLIDKYIKNPR